MGPNPDPLEAFEEEYGTLGSRGIRGGRAAKRKREAYLRYQESQGHSRDEVPVVHIKVVSLGLCARVVILGTWKWTL